MDTAHLYLEQARSPARVEDWRDLANDLLLQAARFKALAAIAEDPAVHDELAVLASHCDTAAATILRHSRSAAPRSAAVHALKA